ncbi:4'-phosphopantetheinyl transferase superfamily protein [Dyadobacter chenwenxiniae]|uniref:4'-phosphopantetheinyl transferase superfamily protein n=1 Tax=Dyadobacter chenwenxiniae TaxID=2906456 RepID=A0A9X1PM74_9BACT|nr:4'-phosphopantetheinyl transferase superfamily protein [Dyadobacter chenwenxiniae]MCF0063690.1 4'-phosphopantetheinyl transferase superfamily protein [Dyadobacter chenwenxiniae]UON83366.1 4'-phosphopantetheinyl transferase superfamily protein [Dyadobacter chenwenxiniae]
MPICYIKSISDDATLGLWHMSESWQDLKEMVKLPATEWLPLEEKKTDKRKQEWLACRVLLQEMAQSLPIISYDKNRKPHIKGSSKQLSMSHSGDYVCVYVHDSEPVGVDLQQMKPSITKGSDYFLNEAEQHWADLDDNVLLHLIWCAKEAVFKFAGDADMDLKKHIITNPFKSNQNGIIEVSIQKENVNMSVQVQHDAFDDYLLAWTV